MVKYVDKKPEPRPRSWVKYDEKPCVVNRWTYPHATFNFSETPCVWTHNGCQCNQIIALQYRHQIATPEMTRDINENLITKTFAFPNLQPYTRPEVIRDYNGAWRTKYQMAYLTYKDRGLQRSDGYVNMFCKDDLEMGRPSKAPRAIQFRNPVFALEQARFTKPVEKWFYALKDEYDTKIVGKSDPFTIAEELCQKANKFANPCFLLLDASKFDTCVSKQWIEYCRDVYCKLFHKKYHRKIRMLWNQTIVNRGFTRQGVRYKTYGTRMSGDMDTGLGNSIIMWTMLKSFLLHNQVKGSILVNGDDSVVVIERTHLCRVSDMSFFKELGFNMKFEVAHNIDEVEFCQARIIETDYGVTMARNPARVMGRTSFRTTRAGKGEQRAFINTLGLCERAASWGVPIASAMASKMIEEAGTNRKIYINPWLEKHYAEMQKWWKTGDPSISLQTRCNFERVWGITVEEQLRIENSIRVKILAKPTAKQWEEYHYLTN